MSFTPASQQSLSAFWVVLLSVVFLFLWGVWKTGPKGDAAVHRALIVGSLLALELRAIGWAVESGYLEAQPMPRLLVLMLGTNLVAAVTAFSPIGRALATLPITYLVLFQAFRFPLELILHRWAKEGVIPATMTWSGLNWDIITGLLALATAPWVGRLHWLAWVFNGVGLVLLINVARVAVLSSPLPFGWGVHPPLQLAYHLPYVFIVPVCVAGALLGHIVLTRALLKRAK